jgi:hypothetical protein
LHGVSFIIIALYVDDAILVCNTPFLLQHIKTELQSTSVMIDHGVIHHLLGMQILHNYQANTLFLTQAHYIQIELELFGINLCKLVATPLEVNLHLSKDHALQFVVEMDIIRVVPHQ